MKFINDIKPIFNKYELTLIESENLIGHIYSFKFRSDKNLEWKPGQHGAFLIKLQGFKKPFRAFSIASIPEDGYIEVATKIGENPSDFKKKMLKLETGDTIKMRGPIGGFYLENTKHTLLIAGGIGITPFKSILKSIKQSDVKPSLTKLIYIDSNEEHIYKEDLTYFAGDPSIDVNFIGDREKLYKMINDFVKKNGRQANYYIAGAPGMVKAVKKFLKERNVTNSSIYKDCYLGY